MADCVSEEANVSGLARNSTDNHISCTHVNNKKKEKKRRVLIMLLTKQDECPPEMFHRETSVARHNRGISYISAHADTFISKT